MPGMSDILVGVRSKEGSIDLFHVEGQKIEYVTRGEDKYWQIIAVNGGGQVIINFDALVYAGPSNMIKEH
jgi:hypothetical protein